MSQGDLRRLPTSCMQVHLHRGSHPVFPNIEQKNNCTIAIFKTHIIGVIKSSIPDSDKHSLLFFYNPIPPSLISGGFKEGGGGGGGAGPRAFSLSWGHQNNFLCFRTFRSHASFLFPYFILFPYLVCIAFFRYKIPNLAYK